MRVGIYLARHASESSGMAIYSRALVQGVLKLLARPEHEGDEVILYGDEAVVDRDLIQQVSLSPVLSVIAEPGLFKGADSYFRSYSNGSRVQILVRKLPTAAHKVMMLADQILVPYYVYRDRPDIVHCTSNYGIVWSSSRQIITVHDLFQAFPEYTSQPSYDNSSIPSRATLIQNFYRLLFRLQFRRADYLITDIKSVGLEICKRFNFDRGRIATIALGLDDGFKCYLDKYSASERVNLTELWCEANDVKKGFVLLLASADPRKNLENQLDAWIGLSKQARSRDLVILGADETLKLRIAARIKEKDKHDLAQSKENRQASSIVYLNRIDREEVPVLFEAAGVILNATLAEGFGLPALEGLAVGSKVVSGSIDSLQAITSANIYYCQPGDVRSIRSALERALADLDDSVADTGSNRANKEKFRTMEDAVLDTYNLYRQICARYPSKKN